MQNKKNFKFSQNGITMISLIVTIVVMLILTTIIVTDTDTGAEYKKYKLMCADVQLLEDKILIYYNEYGELPVIGETVDVSSILESEHEFKKIDTAKLNNLTLNYGTDEDIYIIDTTTFEVYYKNGIKYDNTTYYTNSNS